MTAQFQLVMRSGPTPGTTYALEGDQIIIGRDPSNGIVINDAEISRRHTKLTFQGGKYVVEDMGSTNGTFVNGQRIGGPHVLKPGEVVSLGEQISLMFESIDFDPNATMASSKGGVATVAKPAPMPRQAYAGQVPAGPPAPAPISSMETGRRSNVIPIVIAVLVFLCICACAGFFLWVDSDATGQRWCDFLPFLVSFMGRQCP